LQLDDADEEFLVLGLRRRWQKRGERRGDREGASGAVSPIMMS
jgi:hypothetical protein